MLFTLITVLLLAGVLVRQTRLRFAAANARAGNGPEAATWSGYGKWLGPRMKSTFTKTAWRSAWTVLSDWARTHYPGWTKWIFAAFGEGDTFRVTSSSCRDAQLPSQRRTS